ncbi:MAG: HlyD family efflux transporter periplasmic adaptor subunit [Caldisericia bacterium]
MRRFTLILIIFILIILLLNYKTIFSYLSLPKTYKIEKIEDTIFLKKQGVILLNQYLTYSPYEGTIKFYIDDLSKVPKDFLICEVLTQEGIFNFYSKDTGIVSRRIEESDLVFDKLKENPFLITDEKFNNKVKILNDGDYIKEGEPIFRLIDNLEGYIYIKIDNDIQNFIKENQVYLKMSTNGEIFKGEIVQNSEFLKIKFNKFIEYFVNTKIYIFEVLIYSGSLIKIPEKYVKKGGVDLKDEDGLNRFIPFEGLKYIRKDGFYIFPEIEENKTIFKLIGKEIIS